MKQLFLLCRNMTEAPIEKVYQDTFLCSVSLSSLSSTRQGALATVRGDWLRCGEEKCLVLEWKEIAKGINSMTPPAAKMSINQTSGQASTATLRALLPKHKGVKSKVEPI